MTVSLLCFSGLQGAHSAPPEGSSPQSSAPPVAGPVEAVVAPVSRWEKEISAFEASDRLGAPEPGGLVFIGSSTVRLWKTLREDFPGRNVLNRGFGGSQISDAVQFVERIVLPYRPAMVLLRSGGNDLHAGKSPDRVFGDFKVFVEKIRAAQPGCEVVFIGLCPAPVRWSEAGANKTLNGLVEEYAKTTPGVGYIETYDMSLDGEGQVREDLFVADRLHLNAEGYRLLAERVRAHLERSAKPRGGGAPAQ